MNLIELKDIKRGYELYEYAYGEELRYVALEDARRVSKGLKNGWSCWVIDMKTEKRIELYIHHKITAYGPHLYMKDEDGK